MPRPLTPVAMTVLRLLNDGPLHPYEIQQRIREQALDEVVKVTHGALYHTVERLAESGLIKPVETSREGRRPERTVYAITEDGLDQANEQLRDFLQRPAREYPCFAMALAFVAMLPAEDAARLLDRRCVALEAMLAAHGTAMDSLIKQGLTRLHLIEVEYLRSRWRAELDFTRALVDDIRSGRLSWDSPEGNE